ncbi:hypothetical protein RHM25_00025 [Clostridioides difficile]|nr:hypothetical protein [Clostridioides difficile]
MYHLTLIDRLTNDEIEETIKYCRYDVEQTIDVFIERNPNLKHIWD